MALTKELLDKMDEMEERYGRQWGGLADDHPDIVELQRLYAKCERGSGRKPSVYFKFQENHIQLIKEYYLIYTDQQTAEMIGATKDSVTHRRQRMGLLKPRNIKKEKGVK